MDNVIKLAYACWRWDMWINDYGSYESIDWAVEKRLLRPLKKPWRITSSIVKWAINHYSPWRYTGK